MPHPHQYLLQEFHIAIQKFVPTVPEDIKEQSFKLYTDLLENESSSEQDIHNALISVGKNEFPHRHAFHELTDSMKDAKQVELLFSKLPAELVEKIKTAMGGDSLEDMLRSETADTMLTGVERQQIEDVMIDVSEALNDSLKEGINADAYKASYEKWQKQMELMQTKIDTIRAFADQSEKWKEEILGKVAALEEGWSVTEQDPELERLEKEIEYWEGKISE